MVLIATDRQSAFDRVLAAILFKPGFPILGVFRLKGNPNEMAAS